MNLVTLSVSKENKVDLNKTYDAVIVGSGAAGGMAAHVLTSHGMKCLMLEAGKKLNMDEELQSMQWPYEHPRRGDIPYDTHSLTFNEYNIRDRPYAKQSSYNKVLSYIGGQDFTKNILVNEKEHPYTGTKYAWVRARLLGGKTNIWGRVALRFSDYDFKGKTHDGYGEDWPLSYTDVAPYYDKVDLYLGISGQKENLPQLPDSIYQRPIRLTWAEYKMRERLMKTGRVVTPTRVGVATDGVKHNKYRSRCYGRGACNRRGGCDIHAAFDSPTGLIYPATDTGNLEVRPNSVVYKVLVDEGTGRASGVSFLDGETLKSYDVKAKVVVLAASTLESARLMLLSKSRQHPNGIGNTSNHVGHNFCEHMMGPGASALVEDLVGKPHTLDDARPTGFYIPRFRNVTEKRQDYIRGFGYQGGSGLGMTPGMGRPGFGAAYKKEVRDYAGATIGLGGFGEALSRYENAVSIDPEIKDKWGVPVLKFDFTFGENEKKMAEDMANTAGEMLEVAGFKNVMVNKRILTEGWSIHELGTARMGSDAKSSVLNQYQQSHDVRNLFVVDGSSHVNAGCVNPTWTIMALCWRSMDYLADEMKRGNI